MLELKLNERQIEEKVTNDRFGLFVANEWKRLIDPYTPQRTGALMGLTGTTVDIAPFSITYRATQTSGGEALSKSYAEIVYTKPFSNYTKPSSTHHWDKAAEQAGQKDKLYQTINNALISGKI